MISNVCKIKKGAVDLSAILDETEKVTRYNALSPKQSLSLRLLAEELVCMLPSMVNDFDGEFYIKNEGNEYELCVKIFVDEMDIMTRDSFIKVSKNNKNASVKGISGKIRAVFDYMVMGGDAAASGTPTGKYGLATNLDFSSVWTLQQYKNQVSEEESEKWDELEKSIIAKVSDDVIVGVKGKNVIIIIKKMIEEKNI